MTTYKDYMTNLTNDLIDILTTNFNNSSNGQCSSNKIITQAQNLYIGKDFKDVGKINYPNDPTKWCEIDLSQKIDLSGQNVCVDINAKLLSMTEIDKSNLINKSLDTLFIRAPLNIRNNLLFVNAAKQKIIETVLSVSANVEGKCSQNIYIDQNQNIYLLGDIQCQNSKLEFSQTALVKQFMKCIVQPSFDSIIGDTYLEKLFNMNPNKDCIYEKVLSQSCDGNNKKYTIKMIQNKSGGGTCEYTDGQNITEPCGKRDCQVSGWSNWSECLEGKQTRNRKIIQPGEGCPDIFEETQDCTENIRQANLRLRTQDTIIGKENNINREYDWFVLGPKSLENKQKYVLYSFLIFLTICYIYSLV